MILVDTSIWIDHLRQGNARLVRLLESGQVLSHPFVIGELALGNLQQRDTVLVSLQDLPQTITASDSEVLTFVERYELQGLGIGWVDAHLLAATRLTPDAQLWTQDKRLAAVAGRLALVADV
jgi:predicted nucleic acid-binding protein